MSFLSDLFHGNFSNLGTDLSHAPSSFVRDIGSEAPYLIGAAALGGGLLLGPALLGGEAALGGAAAADAGAGGLTAFAPAATDLTGTAADLTAAGGAADLTAANAAFGTFDPSLFAVNAADAGIAGTGVDLLGTGALSAADLGAVADTGALTAADAGAGVTASDLGAPIAATDFAPLAGGDLSGGGSLSAFAPDTASADTFSGIDTSGGMGMAEASTSGTVDSGVVPPGATPSATPGGFAPTDTELAGGTTGTAPADTTTAGTTAATTAAKGGGGFLSDLTGGSLTAKDALTLGLAGAPLALALARGESSLPPQAQQAQANSQQLAAFGQQQLAQGQAGTLNAGQMAYLQNMQNTLNNQALQTMYNMGVKDPTRDSRWPQMQAQIQLQISAQTQQFIQQEIQNGLSALGSSSGTLTNLANMQMNADTQFTNTLVNAVSSGARVLAGGTTINVGGGTTIKQAA